MLRAKFTVSKKIETRDGFEVELVPVTNGSAENEKFYKYTPYGSIVLGLVNKDSADNLEVGKSYYIDITKINEKEKNNV